MNPRVLTMFKKVFFLGIAILGTVNKLNVRTSYNMFY